MVEVGCDFAGGKILKGFRHSAQGWRVFEPTLGQEKKFILPRRGCGSLYRVSRCTRQRLGLRQSPAALAFDGLYSFHPSEASLATLH